MTKESSGELELLLSLYLDDIAYARHHEDLRSTVTNLILAIGAALGGLIGFDEAINASDVPSATFLVMLGIGGAIFCYKHYERFHSHYARARELRLKLDSLSGLGILEMKRQADQKHREAFPITHKLSVGWLWTALPLSVSVLGMLVIVAALVQD